MEKAVILLVLFNEINYLNTDYCKDQVGLLTALNRGLCPRTL